MNLHPLSIPYRIAQQGLGIAVVLYFVGAPSLAGSFGPVGGLVALAAGGLLVLLFVAYVVAYYRRFEYDLTAETFDIRSGVIGRREREIPLRRIQNVDISQSFVQRAIGLAEVRLETAGGSSSEARLRYVGTDEADRLQSEISRRNREAVSDETDGEPEAERFETVFSISPGELAVLALVSVDFRVASFLFFGASLFGISAASAMDPSAFWGPETIVGAVFGPLAGVALAAVFGLATGATNATRYYGFELDRGEDELRYERGLFQRFSGTIPLAKVQTITIRENVIARLLGYGSLYIETAGQAGGEGETDGSQSAIPVAERDRVDKLARSIEPYRIKEFARPPKRARQRYAARYALALLGVAGLLYLVEPFVSFSVYWYAPLVALALVPIAAHLKWEHRGFAVGEDHVVTRNGFWVRQIKVVPYHRVQTVFSTETIFQRRRRLGTVTVDTAGSRSLTGNDAKAVDVDRETVEDLRESVPDRLYAALAERAGDRSLDSLGRDRTNDAAGTGTPGD